MNELLSICIPTFNRANQLKEQLRKLIPQLNDEVTLTIYDNNSDYDINGSLAGLDLSRVRLVHNLINVGADANIAKCFEHSLGEWLWVLGDDDLVLENAVENALDLIKSHPHTSYINTYAKLCYQGQGVEEFLKYFEIKGTFPGSFCTSHCIYRISELKDNMLSYYSSLTSMIPQFVFLLSYFENSKGSFLFTSKKLIADQSHNISWSRQNFILNTSALIDKWKFERRRYNKDLIKSLGDMYLNFIFKEMSQATFREKKMLFLFVVQKIGIFQLIGYNKVSVLDGILYNLLPHKVYIKTRSKFKLKMREHLLE